MSSVPGLKAVNYLNLIGYIANTVVTFAGVGGEDNATLSEKYQTIITPAGWAFSIWGIIFLFQAMFVILQLLTNYRQLPLVTEGVGYWYLGTCIMQVAWTCAFSYEIIWLSVIFMALILLTLIPIVNNQSKIPSDGTKLEFWLLRFPFSIHCGWIIAAFAVNVNVAVVASTDSPKAQIEWAVVSLIYISLAAIYVLFFRKNPDTTIALVIAWATFAIAIELSSPIDKISATFSEGAITTIQVCCATLCGLILLALIIRAILRFWMSRSNQEGETTPFTQLKE